MRLRLVVLLVTFLFLTFFPLGLRETGLTENVAKVGTSGMKVKEELDSLADLISNLDSSLASFRQMPDQRWERDFFQPVMEHKVIKTEVTENPKKEPLPRVTTIMVNKENSYAILDNQIVRIGDMVKNMRVIKIEMGKVTLRVGNQIIVVTID